VANTSRRFPVPGETRLAIALRLNEDIEHNAILIDGAPEIMLHALDADEDLVHVNWLRVSMGVGGGFYHGIEMMRERSSDLRLAP
jgi:hypothetical protein